MSYFLLFGPVCDSRDITLSPLVLSDPSSSTRAGFQGTNMAEASSVHLSPITLLPGVLQRVHQTAKESRSGRAEYAQD